MHWRAGLPALSASQSLGPLTSSLCIWNERQACLCGLCQKLCVRFERSWSEYEKYIRLLTAFLWLNELNIDMIFSVGVAGDEQPADVGSGGHEELGSGPAEAVASAGAPVRAHVCLLWGRPSFARPAQEQCTLRRSAFVLLRRGRGEAREHVRCVYSFKNT